MGYNGICDHRKYITPAIYKGDFELNYYVLLCTALFHTKDQRYKLQTFHTPPTPYLILFLGILSSITIA